MSSTSDVSNRSETRNADQPGPGARGRHVACALMIAAVISSIGAATLGASLFSILLVGLLLLCPLLMWTPLRYQDRSLARAERTPRGG